MLNQFISMNDGDRPLPKARALVPVRSNPETFGVDPDLRARIEQCAAASGSPVPRVIPGAAATILSLTLPMKSPKHRRAAARFAFEAHLAEPLENCCVAVGPQMSEDVWLCAATDVRNAESPASAFPDICAVPLPEDQDAWSLWWGSDQAYVRFSDGGALALDKAVFHDVWLAFERPHICLYFGVPPKQIAAKICALPDLNPTVLELKLHTSSHSAWQGWGRRAVFSLVLCLATALAHSFLTFKDSRLLAALADERGQEVASLLLAHGLDTKLSDPLSVISATVKRHVAQPLAGDPFLLLLAKLADGVGDAKIEFREMRFDAEQGTLTVQAVARDLSALQSVEAVIAQSGLKVSSGSATRVEAGAEVQLIVSEL